MPESPSAPATPSDGFDAASALARVGGDRALLARLALVFGASSGAALDELDAALSAGRLEDVESAAHALRGSLATLGAVRASALATAVERAAGAGDADAVRRERPALRAAVQQVVTVLQTA